MSSESQYERDLEQAQRDLAALTKQREDIEVQIARTKRRIALLTELCDNAGILVPIPELDLGGLTEACKTVLRASRKEWLNTTEIKNGLQELGFSLDDYKAPMASITTTVNRLVDSGAVVATPRSNPGATEYKWLGLSDKASPTLKGFAVAHEQKKRRFL